MTRALTSSSLRTPLSETGELSLLPALGKSKKNDPITNIGGEYFKCNSWELDQNTFYTLNMWLNLFQSGRFSQGKDLVDIWDEAHYYIWKKQHADKPLTSVLRFRIRKRFSLS